MTVIYHEDDGNLDDLANKTVGVVGYGDLGKPIALNLQDSHVRVIVTGSADEQVAASRDGFSVATLAAITRQADIIMLMLPDEIMADVYMTYVSPNLKRGDTLVFSSAYNVAFGFIEAPPFVDVGLIAPRTVGGVLRERYVTGEGVQSFVAVGQDASGHTWQTILALARALGLLRAGAVEVSIEQEAELNLFIQQAIVPAVYNIMITAAQLLLKTGYPPEAVLPDLYLAGKFSDYMQKAAQEGLMHALEMLTLGGQYGAYSRLNRFNEIKLERLMEITLEEIRSGDFAQEWKREFTDGYPRLKNLQKQQAGLNIWELEEQTLDMLRGYEG
ncbi:MAG: hypothetical protein H7Y09_01555 [Chitinophagaceae bacterium]|nr:hypothetical protein [Anaerolineae bacterium]